MNRVVLIGRLAGDPEMRTTQSGKQVVSFTLAVDRRHTAEGQPTADFIPCVAWGKLAEVIGQHMKKGRQCGIEGRMQVRTYEKDGTKRYVTEVIADGMTFCGSKPAGDTTGGAEQFGQPEDIPF